MPRLYKQKQEPASSSEVPETLFVSIREGLRLTGVGRTLMQELLDSGRIRSVRAGRRRLIPLDALREFAQDD
jgi:excisionase family DNA binding protein